MGSWHRDHPELAGTEQDPWMANPGHRQAAYDVTQLQGCQRTQADLAQQLGSSEELCPCGRPVASHRPGDL